MQPYFTSNGLVTKALEHAFKLEHIMDLTRLRCLGSLFSMLHQACRNVAQYNANHPDFPMQIEQLERYVQVRARAAQASWGPDPPDTTRPLRRVLSWGEGQPFTKGGHDPGTPGAALQVNVAVNVFVLLLKLRN